VAVGFGIKDAQSAASVAGIADGVVVGSALIRAMADTLESGGDHRAAQVAAVALLAEIRRGVDGAAS
jgi:tryptophan synthase alpha chain